MAVQIVTCAERHEIISDVHKLGEEWPQFIQHELVGSVFFNRITDEFPEYCVAAISDGEVLGRGFMVPFTVAVAGREYFPTRGWDQVLLWAFDDHQCGRKPTAASCIDITIARSHRGKGTSSRILAAMRETARQKGIPKLIAPVRPSEKHRHPRMSMEEYVQIRRDDGLPSDAWLRVHVRAGGKVMGVAPASMTTSGSIAQWQSWTGMPFDQDGCVDVPDALAPVHCDRAGGRAVYVEPNVWVQHLPQQDESDS
jgi:GNAT superfamily N-acetyltransferase